MHRKIVLVSLVIILAFVNWSIYSKEKQLSEGKIVYLALAPVDPRSLMQGDYMALHFRLADDVYKTLPKAEDHRWWRHKVAASDGYVVASLDERNIGSFKSLFNNQALSKNDIVMRYRVRNGKVKFATNAYFFQEGYGKYYRPARYGQFRVDKKGELLLAAVYDKNLNYLGPSEEEIRQMREAEKWRSRLRSSSREGKAKGRGRRTKSKGLTSDDMPQKIKVRKPGPEHGVRLLTRPRASGVVRLVPKRNSGRHGLVHESVGQRKESRRHMKENKGQKSRLRFSNHARQTKITDQRQMTESGEQITEDQKVSR